MVINQTVSASHSNLNRPQRRLQDIPGNHIDSFTELTFTIIIIVIIIVNYCTFWYFAQRTTLVFIYFVSGFLFGLF